MKRATSPKIKVFDLSFSSFCIFIACFRMFRDREHSPSFTKVFMDTPYFRACSSLADFKILKPVKSVKVVIEYE